MEFIVRKGIPEDAEQVLAYMDEILAEPGINFVTEPGEFKLTLAEEREFIQRCNSSDNNLYLVAEAGGKLIGLLTMVAQDKRAVRHAPELGISVRQAWRGPRRGHRLARAGAGLGVRQPGGAPGGAARLRPQYPRHPALRALRLPGGRRAAQSGKQGWRGYRRSGYGAITYRSSMIHPESNIRPLVVVK